MRSVTSTLLALSLLWVGVPLPAAGQAPAPDLAKLIEQSYLELFDQAPTLAVSPRTLRDLRKTLERQKKQERRELGEKKKALEREIKQAQEELKQLDKTASPAAGREEKRHDLHCRIQELRQQVQETELTLKQGVEIAYNNKEARLKLLEEWPTEYARLQELMTSEKAPERKFGDFRDIGVRDGTFGNQANDVKLGSDAYEEMKHQGILPPQVEDALVVEYVRGVAERIARNSDLQVPLRVVVLQSKEINAFALPGGLLFVNSGLVLKAGKESELAGVIAHEIAHSAARHGHRLMKRATIASLIFQAAQIAALIFTGGAVSAGVYYALQYGFYGLGLVLNLQLLGVSRDFEIEADILGTQYLWKAGYNARGFMSFFDTMAREKGYVTGLSWFRTHPPFYERMATTYKEILLLPKQTEAVDDTSDFQRARLRLEQVVREMEEKDREAPTLKRVYECEQKPPASSSGKGANTFLPACAGR